MGWSAGRVLRDGKPFTFVAYRLDNLEDREVRATIQNIPVQPPLVDSRLQDWINESLTLQLRCGCEYAFKVRSSIDRDWIEVYGTISSGHSAPHQHH
jgi:hypothetical protein